MKLLAETNDVQYELNFTENGSQLTAEIDGRRYELETSQPEPNVYLFKLDNKIYRIFVSPNEKSTEDAFAVKVGSQQFEIKIVDPKRLRGTAAAGGQAAGASEIKTAMPGKVVRVLVEQGDEVKVGDGVIIVEAMKMQNEMKAPKDGIVKEIQFAEGTTVNAGDVLVVIE
jgi:biotin carboxyl carrier protein